MRLTIPPVIKRLTTREYLPMAGWLGTWAMIALALGHADAVRFLAANTFVQAVRALCSLELTQHLNLRVGASNKVYAASRKFALRLDFIVLLTCVALIIALAAAVHVRGATELAWMMVGMAVGLPARHPGIILIADREHAVTWRAGTAVASLAGGAAILFLGLDWWWAAVLFGLREWGGLLLSAVAARPKSAGLKPRHEQLAFHEVAAHTEFVARRRITYRLAKSLLGAVLGPLGSVVARTGRGIRLDSKLSRMVPRHRGGMALFTLVTAGGSAALLILSREPLVLLLAATVARLAASGGSSLLWWHYGGAQGLDDDLDDD